ncbi:MAG: PEP-utilizing enzyme [Candidatus Kerfeldbacteria bacterium]
MDPTPSNMLKKHWFTAATTGVPLFICTTAGSGVTMGRSLGYSYRNFLYRIKNDYAHMNYDHADLERIWRTMMKKIGKNPHYLPALKAKYRKTIRRNNRFLKTITPVSLWSAGDARLLSMFKRCAFAQSDSVGIGHVCETIGIHGESVFNDLLATTLLTQKKSVTAAVATSLTAPKKPSFLKHEEQELLTIDDLRGVARSQALRHHVRKYNWIRNTYAGPVLSDAAYFTKHLFTLRTEQQPRIQKARVALPRLPRSIVGLARTISFIAEWQDERKENILRVISYLGLIAKEIEKRTRVPISLLGYLSLGDITNLMNLDDIKSLTNELRQRTRGCFILQQPNREIIVSGTRFVSFNKGYERMLKRAKGNESYIYGTVANPGRAVGRVVMCQGPKDISRVRRGDILVASMTRPEIMPAVKKASAIVTDEGGITCHAAIVSRELGIPCIIGTKVATSVLREGDRVEVNANHGVVRKLQ